MGRPSAPTLLEGRDHLGRDVSVMAVEGPFALCLDGVPVTLRHVSSTGLKVYSKTLFPTKGHALVLARRLNAAMGTDGFTVRTMAPL